MKTTVTNVLCPYGDHILVSDGVIVECKNPHCEGLGRKYQQPPAIEMQEIDYIGEWWDSVNGNIAWSDDIREIHWEDISDIDRAYITWIYRSLDKL